MMIAGPKEDLERFITRAGLRQEEPAFLLSQLYPEPDYKKDTNTVIKQIAEAEGEESDPSRGVVNRLRRELLQSDEPGWYEWRIANWGTKWNPSDVHIIEEIDSQQYPDEVKRIEIIFSSPWCAPEAGLKKIFAEEQRLSMFLFYSEPGCDFEGELGIVAGEVTFESQREARPDWHWMTEDSIEELIKSLSRESEEE
jgi:hypothetical protein